MGTASDEVTLAIEGHAFHGFETFSFERSLDTVSSFSFEAPFEPGNADHRETFRPFTFKALEVAIGDEPVLTGTMVDVLPEYSPDRKAVSVSGYGKPGVLECPLPASAFPLEFKGLKLDSIARAIAAHFGIEVVFEADVGAKFDKAALEPGDAPQGFLIDLAKQRGLVFSDDAFGRLRFWKSVDAGSPVASLEGGWEPLVRVVPEFAPQSYFSEITAIAGARRGRGGSKFTVKNPWLTTSVRPHSFDVDDTDPADAPTAAAAKLGRMFGEVAAYSIEELPTWRDPSGKLWTPNTTIVVSCPGVMIYEPTEFVIRSVMLEASAERKIATLRLALPGCYSGKVPTTLPWLG